MAKHLRSAIPAFGIPQGMEAAYFRSLMTWCHMCGCDDAARETLWDTIQSYIKAQPSNVPLNVDALAHHLEHVLDPHAAEMLSPWYGLVKEHGPDHIAPPARTSMEQAEEEWDGLMRHHGENPSEYSRFNQARSLEIAQKRERAEQYEARSKNIRVDRDRLDELMQASRSDPRLWWSEKAKPLREELSKLVAAVDNGAEPVSGEDDLLPHEQEFAEPNYIDHDSDSDGTRDDAAEWTAAMFPNSGGDDE